MTPVPQAWQQALATEYATVFGYGVLGPRLGSAASVALARTGEQAHRDLGERTAGDLSAAGHVPVAPAADYPLPYPVTDDLSAKHFAIRLESGCASAWRYLISVAASDGGDSGSDADQLRTLRAVAQAALTASAVRAMRWRQLIDPAKATVPFPGIG
jgi:hypothetical protein